MSKNNNNFLSNAHLWFSFSFPLVVCSKFDGKEQNIYQFQVKKITGEALSLNSFKGRPLLIVNIATQCGFTPQLKSLQTLNQRYRSRGLIVLGVPSNDFGGQTPQENKEVKTFVKILMGSIFF